MTRSAEHRSASGEMPSGADHSARTVATRRGRLGWRWLTGFVLIFAVIALWSLATPRFAAPDEPAQAIKAAATVRGELVGHHPPASPAATIRFSVPKTIALGTNPGCFAFHPEVSAGCAAPWRPYSGSVAAESYVGRYPPLYYLLVGLPSLMTSGTSVLWWMRLVSAAVAAVFLAGAFVAASLMPRPRWLLAGVAAAMTPMVVFLGGVINPSGLEISSALCLWVSGLALLSGAADAYRRWLLAWSVMSGAVMVQLRGLSPLLLVIIVATLAVLAGRARLRELARQRAVWAGAGVVTACSVFALSWIVLRGSLLVKPVASPIPPTLSNAAVLRAALEHVGLDTNQPIGVFGWLDTVMPGWCYRLWDVLLLGVLIAALRARAVRPILAALALTIVSILLPTLLAYSQARQLGIVGQGRYILPVAVGIPVLLGYAASTRTADSRPVRIGLATGAVALAAVQVTAFVQALHRYRTGARAPIWTSHAAWSPPINWWVAIVLFGLLILAVAAWWLDLARNPPESSARSPL